MHHLRAFGSGLAIFLFVPLIMWLAFAIGLNRTVSNPDYVKQNLGNSGLYSVMSMQAESAFLQDREGNEVPEPVRKVLAATLTPATVQSVTEQAIDKAYVVLDDPDALKTVGVDISSAKREFKASLQTNTEKYLRALPVCRTAPVSLSPSLETIDCRTLGMNIQKLASQSTADVMNRPEVPKDIIVLGDALGGNTTAAAFVTQISQILHLTELGMYVGGLLLLLVIAAILFLAKSFRGGLHRLTTLILTAAILMAGMSGLLSLVLQHVNFGGTETITFESALGSSLRLLALDVAKISLYFAAALGAVGVVLLIGLYATEKKNPSTAQHSPSATMS